MTAETLTLPEMCDAVLDAATVGRLFADLAACTTVLGVIEKGPQRGYVAPAAVPLDAARDRFLAGAVRGVQVRYLFDGREWCDTLMQTPLGVRLVRCQYAA